MEKELINELNILKDKTEELLDRANTVASELVLIESDCLEKLEEQKIYKMSNDDHLEFKDNIEKVLNNFSFDNCFDLFKIFSEKLEFISGDISMAEAICEGNIEEEVLVFYYIKVAFCLKDLDLMLNNFDFLIKNLSNLK